MHYITSVLNGEGGGELAFTSSLNNTDIENCTLFELHLQVEKIKIKISKITVLLM